MNATSWTKFLTGIMVKRFLCKPTTLCETKKFGTTLWIRTKVLSGWVFDAATSSVVAGSILGKNPSNPQSFEHTDIKALNRIFETLGEVIWKGRDLMAGIRWNEQDYVLLHALRDSKE